MSTTLVVPMHVLIDSKRGIGRQVGLVEIRAYRAYSLPRDTPGIALTVFVLEAPLEEGQHGFHLHEIPALGPKVEKGKLMLGGAAGQHYDPQHTGMHLGPYAEGHLGDLPSLTFSARGDCLQTVYAPRLRLQDVRGRALIIHHGPDNYSDYPEPNGGGCDRRLGGVIA